MAQYETPKPDELTPAQVRFYEAITSGERAQGMQLFPLTDDQGRLQGPFGVLLHAPQVGEPMQQLGAALRFHTTLEPRLREITILLVAAHTGSSYERFAHERVAQQVGITPEECAQLAAGTFTGNSLAEQLGVTFVQQLLSCESLSEERGQTLHSQAAEVFTPEQLVELITLVGYYRTLAQLMNTFGVVAPATLSAAPTSQKN